MPFEKPTKVPLNRIPQDGEAKAVGVRPLANKLGGPGGAEGEVVDDGVQDDLVPRPDVPGGELGAAALGDSEGREGAAVDGRLHAQGPAQPLRAPDEIRAAVLEQETGFRAGGKGRERRAS